jgi:hypothetical protein
MAEYAVVLLNVSTQNQPWRVILPDLGRRTRHQKLALDAAAVVSLPMRPEEMPPYNLSLIIE